MDQFHVGQHVRLRSLLLDTYLHADEDGEHISLSPHRDSLRSAWTVHIYQGNDGVFLLLHSAAYGRYLATTATPAPLGHHGFRTEQRYYDQEDLQLQAAMWQAAGAGFRDLVLLRNVAGRYLRANATYLTWNTGVTVDDEANFSAMMYWIVEPIPAIDGPPNLPDPCP